MKNLYILVAFVLTSVLSNGQTWEKLFSHNSTDVFRSVREVPSGGFILSGYISGFTANDTDAYVVRLNNNGDTAWTYTYNGSLSRKDLFYKAVPTSDGGFIAAGYTTSVTGTSDDFLVVKLSSSGQEEWVKAWGNGEKERVQDIIEIPNGYIICGYTTTPSQYYQAVLMELDDNGDINWSQLYGDANYDDANAVRQHPGGGYILAGQSQSGGNFEDYLIRTADDGDLIWQKKFGTGGIDNADYMTVVSDGFVLAGGTTGAGAGGNDGYIVKTDTAGNVVWSKTYGGSGPDDFHRVEETNDGGFILCGTSSSFGNGNPDMWVVKTNASGDSSWAHTYGGDNHDHGYSAMQVNDGGFILAGHTGSYGFNHEEAYVVKTDANGISGDKLTYTTVFDIVSPSGNGCGNANMQVKVRIRNFGNVDVPNVPATIEVTGPDNQTITGLYGGTFNAQDMDTLVFTARVNTAAGGTYTFTCYTDNNNDVYPARNSYTKTFNFTAAPDIDLGNDTNVAGTASLLLDAGAGFSSYEWSDGSTGQTYLATTTDTFCVEVTGGNGCVSTDCIFVDFFNSIDEIAADLGYEFFPNPTAGELNISFKRNLKDCRIEIFNSTGAIVHSEFAGMLQPGVTRSVLLSDAPGLYLLKISEGNRVDSRMFIKN